MIRGGSKLVSFEPLLLRIQSPMLFRLHIKGYSHALNRKNRFQRLGPRKGATVLRRACRH